MDNLKFLTNGLLLRTGRDESIRDDQNKGKVNLHSGNEAKRRSCLAKPVSTTESNQRGRSKKETGLTKLPGASGLTLMIK